MLQLNIITLFKRLSHLSKVDFSKPLDIITHVSIKKTKKTREQITIQENSQKISCLKFSNCKYENTLLRVNLCLSDKMSKFDQNWENWNVVKGNCFVKENLVFIVFFCFAYYIVLHCSWKYAWPTLIIVLWINML